MRQLAMRAEANAAADSRAAQIEPGQAARALSAKANITRQLQDAGSNACVLQPLTGQGKTLIVCQPGPHEGEAGKKHC